jgi:ATPase
MIGVTHASKPIDAIQRFVGRVDLGVIPQIIDTIIFINKGEISCVYTLNMVVKVPTSMVEADLARPVVEVRDFYTREPIYELYSFGEEISVIPLKELADKQHTDIKEVIPKLYDRLSEYCKNIYIKEKEGRILIYTDKRSIPKLIGRNGKLINALEREFKIPLDILAEQKKQKKKRKR